MVDAGFLSIIPPIVAIVLALVTKEVIFSLLLGVFSGTIIYSALAGLGPFGVLSTTVEIMIDKFGANADMILFLCFLGILVILITKAGGARAYGEWASSKLKNRRSVLFATALLGRSGYYGTKFHTSCSLNDYLITGLDLKFSR